jgi:DNA-binding transcriptional LysR family regulator
MGAIYDDLIRFEYPDDWEVETTVDGSRTTISLQPPESSAFAFIAIDSEGGEPRELVDEAIDAMRDQYPEIEVEPVAETIAGRRAIGYDVEFFYLDVINSCAIRCFATVEHVVLVFGQWSEIDRRAIADGLERIRATIEAIDLGDESG